LDPEAQRISEAIIDRIDEAWEGEGAVPGDVLAPDAIYVNIPGQLFIGKDAIVAGTRLVKATFKTNVTSRLLIDARRVADGVIIALVRSTASMPERPPQHAATEVAAYQSYVITRATDGEWLVAAYQATRIADSAPSTST
jgi:uncharacterized protein (TIGR02246 family)